MFGTIYHRLYRNESSAVLKSCISGSNRESRALAVLAVAHRFGWLTACLWCNQRGYDARCALQYARFLVSSPVAGA